ncbi:olfactory receptor 6K6 [Cricetulus griseus]|uniref:Olfactory receptor n=2 Tax=Cricetulus griseus TaxID=10029 RepID=G3H817_CRIGR|nr:olfactory receptor 6K6 [Cricetulus griseus]XP_027274868.1 olfactory receptor 6K6 [Cricetulus griseus]EGV93433.1 Olfactory receptor 6K6 [Cricetulus griseus]ERE73321.1 olfactory receptor 6K6-like protein [Cricetulus griseus]
MTHLVANQNQTMVIEFVFSVFPPLYEGGLLFFILLLLVYTFIISGNLVIFVVVQLDMALHTPMYFFISVLSFLEIWYTTTTIPKMLSSLASEKKTISLAGCLMQMYFFHSLGITEGCVLTAMSIDRYIAICYPLRYPTIMTSRLCIQLTAGSCFCGFLLVLPEIAWIATLPFCGSNKIHQIFCDFTPVLSLACTDTSLVVIVDVIHAVEILASFLVIALSYIRIIVVILGMPSAEGRHKAFSTCAAHLAVFLLFFGSVAVMYLRFSATYSVFWDTVIAVTFVILAPFLNPIIYSLRNKEMKDAIGRLFQQKRNGGVQK